jgi:hypothetical protein
MPTGEIAQADGAHPLSIPSASQPGWTDRMIAILKGMAGDDIGIARTMANVREARTRAMAQADEASAIAIPGLLGDARQTVLADQPLLLRWTGGHGAYSVKLADAHARVRAALTTTDQHLELPTDKLDEGDYDLTIDCPHCLSVLVPVKLVRKARLPSTPEIDTLSNNEEKDRLLAVWLLTEGPDEWRLQALSLLQFEARDRADMVAQAILAPEAP